MHAKPPATETEDNKRVPRLAVFRGLCPITDLVGATFWGAFWECFRCHSHQWRSGIHHCDISISNLMYDKDNDRGILNDFDLALPQDHPSSSGTERTGTMLFMALELLNAFSRNDPLRREYRHDAESFAWILLWICCTYVDGKELAQQPLRDLIRRDFRETHVEKWAKVRNPREGLEPTASYRKEYLGVTHSILLEYRDRHLAAGGEKYTFNEDERMDGNGAGPGHPGDELAAVETELRMWRKKLAVLGPSSHVDL